MKSKMLSGAICTALFGLTLSVGAVAQNPNQMNFSGVINDYTPSSTVTPVGPWEIRGDWTLMLRGTSGASFSADLTMVRSDYWVVLNPSEMDTPQDRTPHTHHISLVGGTVSQITGGFQVTGSATITANGSPAGFSPSPLTIQVVGGMSLPYSNVKLIFEQPAAGHFGTFPLDGIVRASH